MLTPKEQEIQKLERDVEIILELMIDTDDDKTIRALHTAYWVMMNQIVRLSKD